MVITDTSMVDLGMTLFTYRAMATAMSTVSSVMTKSLEELPTMRSLETTIIDGAVKLTALMVTV